MAQSFVPYDGGHDDLPYKGAPPPAEVVSAANGGDPRRRKRRVIAVAAVIVVIGVLSGGVAALFGGGGLGNGGDGNGDAGDGNSGNGSPAGPPVQSLQLPPAGSTVRVEVEEGAVLGAPPSASGEVVVITDAANKAPQARSYDGLKWEAMHGASVECGEEQCRIRISNETLALAKGAVLVSTYAHAAAKPEALNARFLMQATFGPTRADIAALGSASEDRFRSWIEAQAAERPTQLRELFRRRVNAPARVQTLPGRARGACEAGSRWHRHAFIVDDVGRELTVVEHPAYIELLVDGVPRHHWADKGAWNVDVAALQPLLICSVDFFVGGRVRFGARCAGEINNPAIHFDAAAPPPPERTLNVGADDLEDLTPVVYGHKLLRAAVTNCAVTASEPTFVKVAGGDVLLHDPRLVLLDNTLENPAPGELGASMCPSAPRSFLNQDSCVVRVGGCAPAQYTNVPVQLDAANLRKFFTAGGKYVYRMTGLNNDAVASPCARPSRWSVEAGACAAPSSNIDPGTLDTLRAMFGASFFNDRNAFVRDIPRPANGAPCNEAQARRAVIQVEHEGQQYCFSQVHPDLFNVYDFSYWTLRFTHPGNKGAFDGGRPNPIAKHAEQQAASTDLPYPGSHPTSRWELNKRLFGLLGRFGDTVGFRRLPGSVQTPALAKAFGAAPELPTDPAQVLSLSCGSPGEVASDPRLGSRFGFSMVSLDDADPLQGRLDELVDRRDVQSTAWMMAALESPDQLRQRVAWALSQIMVVSARGTNDRDPTEMYVAYYDIFVRNALGSYRDALREVSYSPMMGRMLSFAGSRSLPSSGSFPDENYAREVMQLFTMGLVELNDDGSAVLDAKGAPVPTYTNEDILEFARLWTGFDWQPPRSNMEFPAGDFSANDIDPMMLRGDRRDPFPKLGLRGRYVGDGYPVCEELPERAFLRKGAVYRFLGARPLPELQDDPTGVRAGELALRVELDPAKSALAAKLCGSSDATDLAKCDWKAQVELDANLACEGIECEIDSPRIVMLPVRARRCPADTTLELHGNDRNHGDVCRNAYTGIEYRCPAGCSQVADNAAPFCVVQGGTAPCRINPYTHTGIFFEYVRPACVHLSYFNDGKRIGNVIQDAASCANPRSIIAGEACCEGSNPIAANKCLYSAERLTFATAQKRCATRFAPARAACDFVWLIDNFRCPVEPLRAWTTAPCGVQVKVSVEGKVAIVHDVGQSPREENTVERMRGLLSRETNNWFRALWAEPEAFPSAVANGCADGACELLPAAPGEQPTCLCNTETSEQAVFDRLPSLQEALDNLHIGSAPVDSFDAGVFAKAGTPSQSVQAYKLASGVLFDKDTVFEVNVPGLGTRWLRNARSVVTVRGADTMQFRNPPTFHDPDIIETRDAMHETEAVLDHYMEHPTTAPFLAKSLIQHLVTSNPGPRYVKVVTQAFRSGKYEGLGSGKYGDLLATTAAVLLDPEARNAVLDADPAAGQHRQAMLKVTHVMRALEYVSHTTLTVLPKVYDKLGVEPMDAPSVFSFYLPGYAPTGPIKKASLVAPETQLLTTPKVVAMLDGLFSLVKHGLTACDGGLGLYEGFCDGISYGDVPPDQSRARGRLTYKPSVGAEEATGAQVAAELSLLLTADQLDAATAAAVAAEYEEEKKVSGSADKALRVAAQIVLASPHFHSSNQCQPRDEPRSEGPPKAAADPRPYKAVVYVNMLGGMDSFNALVPKAGCVGGKDLYAEYARVRGDLVALEHAELLDIDTTDQGQPCSTFGLNPSLDTVQALYAAGDAVFMANLGALVEPIATKQSGGERPKGLFAHNIQQRATQTAVPQSASGTGVLGRLQDALIGAGFNAASYSIDGNADVLSSDKEVAPRPEILDRRSGVPILDRFPSSPRLPAALKSINAPASTSLFGEAWSGTLTRTINRTLELDKILNAHELKQEFKAGLPMGEQLEQVARLINARESLGNNRNAFYVGLAGFDTHNNGKATQNYLLAEIDDALDSFVQELKLQGVWDDVVIIFASEFGRTLTNNGAGTDHAWGGNYWMAGGGLKGGRVLGTYPDDLTNRSPLNLGRGRLIPTTSWNSVWNGVAEWLGLTDAAALDEVLPNRANFADQLWSGADLFVNN